MGWLLVHCEGLLRKARDASGEVESPLERAESEREGDGGTHPSGKMSDCFSWSEARHEESIHP